MIAGAGPAPTRADSRIDTLDVLRGVAICGILLMNIPYMGAIGETEALTWPAGWTADWIAWGIQGLLFEGTMRGLFTMLFGAGLLLMLRRAEGERAEVAPFDIWARRCLALLALGVVQAVVFMWPGEILWTYGIAGFGLLAFRIATPRTLMVWAALILTTLTLFDAGWSAQRTAVLQSSIPAQAAKDAGRPLTKAQKDALEAARERREEHHPTPRQIADEHRNRTSLTGVIAWSWEDWAQWHLGTLSWLSVAESLGFMLIGMALFRTGILTGAAAPGTYWRLAAIGYALGLAIRGASFAYDARTGFDLDIARIVPWASILRGAAYEPARLAITLGHVGLVVGLYKAGAFGGAWPMRALGRMALTVYSLQSILTAILFYGLGYVGAFGFATLMGIAIAIWILTGLFSVWWLSTHDMGPMEQALRRIAYGRRAPSAARLPDGLVEPVATPHLA